MNFLARKSDNFTEEKTRAIEREKRLKDWPHPSPSPMDILLGGWSLNTRKGKDFTECLHCGAQCDSGNLMITRRASMLGVHHPVHIFFQKTQFILAQYRLNLERTVYKKTKSIKFIFDCSITLPISKH